MTKLSALIAAMAFAGACSVALAADPPANHNPAMREACAADMKSLCPDAAPGQGMMQCMMKNQGKASAGCKTAMANMRQGAMSGGAMQGGGMGGMKDGMKEGMKDGMKGEMGGMKPMAPKAE